MRCPWALFIVNDRVDLALAVEADGVHLGQGISPAQARRLLGPDRLIGRSTHAPDSCNRPWPMAAITPALARCRPHPPSRAEPVGLDYLRQAAQIATIPHYAIGGVDAQLLPALLSWRPPPPRGGGAGCDGSGGSGRGSAAAVGALADG